MTSFDAERLARGWGLIAEGAMEISLAYSAIEPAGARAPAVPDSVPTAPAARAAGAAPPASAAPSSALGVCPVHHTAWTVKAGGISKNGKPYPAFWKCAIRDDQGYCDQKPTKAWADSHPIPLEAVA